MGIITVWECDRTKKLFRTEREYNLHLGRLKRDDAQRAATATRERKHRERLAEASRLTSIADIEQWVVDNRPVLRSPGKLIKLSLVDMHFGEQSITHSAPRGHKTNWGGRDGERRHHLGWYGRIHLCYERGFSGFQRGLETVGIHTGTGGSGWKRDCQTGKACREHLSYDVTLFALDFPDMARKLAYETSEFRCDPTRDAETLKVLFPEYAHFAVIPPGTTHQRQLLTRPYIGPPQSTAVRGFLLGADDFDEAILDKMAGRVSEIITL